MMFQCDNQSYDTADMTQVSTGLSSMPLLYLTQDRRNVFVFTVNSREGAQVSRVDPQTARGLAQRFRLPVRL